MLCNLFKDSEKEAWHNKYIVIVMWGNDGINLYEKAKLQKWDMIIEFRSESFREWLRTVTF